MELLVEMALSRSDAIDLCTSLGEQFIKHYDKLFKEPNAQSRNHWIKELKKWFKKINSLDFSGYINFRSRWY